MFVTSLGKCLIIAIFAVNSGAHIYEKNALNYAFFW